MQSGTCLPLIPSSLTRGTLFRGCTASDGQMKVIVPTSIRESSRNGGSLTLGRWYLAKFSRPPRHIVLREAVMPTQSAMIYKGDNWPDKYRDRLLFTLNLHGARVNQEMLLPHDFSSYVAKHALMTLLWLTMTGFVA